MLKKLTAAFAAKRADAERAKLSELEEERNVLEARIVDALVDDKDTAKLRFKLADILANLEMTHKAVAAIDQHAAEQRQAEADKKTEQELRRKIAELTVTRDALAACHVEMDDHLVGLNALAQSQGDLTAKVKALSNQTGVVLNPDFLLDANRLSFRLKCAVWQLAPWFARAIELPRVSPIHWRTMSTPADKKHAA